MARKFRLKTKEEDIILENPDGTERKIILRELGAEDRDKYTKALAERSKTDEHGNPAEGIKDPTGLQQILLELSLFDPVTGKRVPRSEIDKWPGPTVTLLFRIAQEISLLGVDAGTIAGNA